MRKRFLTGLALALKINTKITLFGLGAIIIMIAWGSKGPGLGIFIGIYYFASYFIIKNLWKVLWKRAKNKAIQH